MVSQAVGNSEGEDAVDMGVPCSAVGSRAALGSSNNSNPTLASSESTARMNIRDLVIHKNERRP